MEYEKLNKRIRNRLIEPEKKFLNQLQNYLGLPLFIYGSLFRLDYFPNKSDIDIAVFADNIEETTNQLIQFLNISKSKIKIFKMTSKNKQTDKVKTIWGFKTNYKINIEHRKKKWYDVFYYPQKNKRFEIMIYSKKYKKYITSIQQTHFSLFFLSSLVIYILKCFHYYFFLNETTYKYLKNLILEKPKKYLQNISIVGTL